MVASLQVQAADKVALNLPSQSLATSLSQVAQKTRIQLLFDEDQLRSIPARALEGQFTAQQAIGLLLMGGGFKLIQVGNTFVVRQIEPEPAAYKDAIQLGAVSILGDGKEVDSSSVGRSTLTRDDIERSQPSNIPSLLATLPGVSMGGSMKPGGQTINIWGLGDAEDVPLTVDGANKSSFERYQQGTIFIEPELIKSIEVEKGPHSPETGNGGFGGTVHTTEIYTLSLHDALPICWKKVATVVPWSSTATPVTTMNRPTAVRSMAVPTMARPMAWCS